MAAIRSPRRALLGVALAVLLGAGCRVDTGVDVAVNPNGSGTVTVTVRLDRAAAARVPDLDQSLLVKDLRATGWKVTGPTPQRGGGVQMRVAKRFARPEDLGAVMSQVSGTDGPFRRFSLVRSHSFAKTTYRLTGTVDLSGGLEAFGDPELRLLLGGEMFGRPVAELEREAGAPLAEAVRFTVRAHLPGGGTQEWRPVLGRPATEVEATSASRAPRAWLFASAAGLAAVTFLVTLVLIVRYNRVHRAPTYVHRPGGARRPWDDL